MIASRTSLPTTLAVPSSTFSATLPVKPSVTRTSTGESTRSVPSTLPMKFKSLSARRSCASTTCSVPFLASSPFESRPTAGRATPFTLSMYTAPM